MPKAVAAFGRISAPMWLIPTAASTWTPSHLVMMNCGIIVTWNGTISVVMITANSSAAAEEPEPGERVPGQRAEHQVAQHGGHRHDRAVDEEPAERRGLQGVRVVGEVGACAASGSAGSAAPRLASRSR